MSAAQHRPGFVRGAPPAAKFAVVVDPGTLMERIDSYASTFLGAVEAADDIREDGVVADVMRITADGRLTTEF